MIHTYLSFTNEIHGARMIFILRGVSLVSIMCACAKALNTLDRILSYDISMTRLID